MIIKNVHRVRHDKVLHIYITQYPRHQALKQQKTGMDTYLSQYLDINIHITVLWNQEVQTEREVLANRPDTIKKKEK
jgi:hypothetical protein